MYEMTNLGYVLACGVQSGYGVGVGTELAYGMALVVCPGTADVSS